MNLYPWIIVWSVGAILTFAWALKASIEAQLYKKYSGITIFIGALMAGLGWPLFWLVALI